MPKYNVNLKVRLEVEGTTLAVAVSDLIYTLTNNFTDVRGLELTNLWEVKASDSAQVIPSEAETPRTIGL